MPSADDHLAGRAFLILGAAGGIGSSLARRLRSSGAALTLAGRTESTVAALAEELEARSAVVDARSFDAMDRCADEALAAHGRLDGVVNCVGSLILKPAHLTREEEWADAVGANLTSAFAAVRAGSRVMGDGGSIVLFSSAAARIGLPNHEAVAAVKGGVQGLVLSAAATYAARGIRVNAVAPGLVETALTERITTSPPARDASLAMHALKRLGRPEDVARLVEWLLDPANDWVTGQVIGVDGGLGSVRSR